MLSALLSFLGGTAFRMVWGEIAAWLTAAREHKRELEMLKLQGELDAAAHLRNLQAIKVQADLGIKVIEAQSAARVGELDAQAFIEAVKATSVQTGIRLVDAWNAVIRPGVATWAVVMLTLSEFAVITFSESGQSVAFAALGIYLADRSLGKRGK